MYTNLRKITIPIFAMSRLMMTHDSRTIWTCSFATTGLLLIQGLSYITIQHESPWCIFMYFPTDWLHPIVTLMNIKTISQWPNCYPTYLKMYAHRCTFLYNNSITILLRVTCQSISECKFIMNKACTIKFSQHSLPNLIISE